MDDFWGIIVKYYGIDVVAFVFVVFQFHFLGNRNKIGWLCGFCACVFFVVFGILAQSIVTVIMNSCFGIMMIRNYVKWSERDDSN